MTAPGAEPQNQHVLLSLSLCTRENVKKTPWFCLVMEKKEGKEGMGGRAEQEHYSLSLGELQGMQIYFSCHPREQVTTCSDADIFGLAVWN